MSTSNSFWDHPIANIEEALHIRKQIDALQTRLSKLVGGTFTTLAPKKSRGRKAGSTNKSPTAATISAKTGTTPGKAKGAVKKRTGLTPEGRARLAASMKARWAARKKAAGQS